MKKRTLHSMALFGLLFSSLLCIQPAEVSASTPRVDTMPENLVHNSEFAEAKYRAYSSEFSIIEMFDANGGLLLVDRNNIANGGYDSTAQLPGWSYYVANAETVTDRGYLYWSRKGSKRSALYDSYTSSEEPTYLLSTAWLKGDYLYQNVKVEGNRIYDFSFLRASFAPGNSASNTPPRDKNPVILVELDSNKNLLRTTRSILDDCTDQNLHGVPVKNSTKFATLANTAYVQIRLEGDPCYTPVSADTPLDSFYLAAGSMSVNYYSGDATNTATGSKFKTLTSDKGTYTLPALSNTEIAAIAPENCTFSGWKCKEDGKTYLAGATMTLPDADSATIVAQWKQVESQISVSFKQNYTSSDNVDAAPAITVKDGDRADAKWPAAPTRSKYIFMGWSTVRSPLTDTSGTMYTSSMTISSTGKGVSNKALTLYALWMEDADGNSIPDALQVNAAFKAEANGQLNNPSAGSYANISGVYLVYLWRDGMSDSTYNLMKALLFTSEANTAIQQIRDSMTEPATLSANMVPKATADNGYVFDTWSPALPEKVSKTSSFYATFKSDAYTLTLDTHGVYPLLYSGTSSQDLAFTLKDGSGKVVTDSSILNQVTFTMELTDGFEKFKDKAGYAVVTLNGSKITAKKSGVVKIYAEYNGVKSTDYAIAVVPGDLNRSGSIDLDDAVQEAVILRDETKVSEFGTYGKELANMNNLNDGVDVDDIVKIVAMVRGISDYYN